MSATARWLIAATGLLCALGFAGTALTVPPDAMNRTGLWIMAAFCVLITVVCFPGRARAVAGRLLGAFVCIGYLAYLFSQWGKPLLHTPYRRSDANLLNALIGFCLFGIPGGYIAVTGQFPRWTLLRDKLDSSATHNGPNEGD